MTAAHTTMKAERMPMLVRSATARIGKTPASTAEDTPASQVTARGGAPQSNLAEQVGSKRSRLMENHTRVTPSRKVSMTVRIERTAKTEMMVAIADRPTLLNADAKPAVGSMSW